MSDAAAPVRIDARGLKCPWPALRLARALRGGADAVEILADDPAAEREIAALARSQGLKIEHFCAEGADGFRIG
ncbi:sulfurtransferase TusA family protein [Sphingomonas suaedae]|uniref:Sulfurtransferase TusA family protein n=1 Tax=Sphingomonas suaedae TaxID=2599297 RepID=A0A518RCW8_9SPHN|nr:sulfurtransferase TusA family protein [Sphingomonas suaedae]QDX25315.1 sulfurtransferase TusA family protein [Sphingomonas suaedae]